MWLKASVILVVFTAVFAGIIYQNNPVLFGTTATKKSHAFYDHTVYEYYPHLDDELFSLAFAMDKDFGAYRNHCLRVLTFTKHFLPKSTEEDLPDAIDLAATAIAYLRVGLWTDQNLNYVESSRAKLETALGDSFSPEKMSILREIILQQHKITDYTGMSSDAANALVNAVRKASWTDATMGLFRFDLPASLLESAYDVLDGAGFHSLFWGRFTKLSPDIVSGCKEAGDIVKW